MLNKAIYRLMAEEDAGKVYELTKKVFDRFVAHTFEQKGIEEFYEIINPESILRRREENHFALIAEVDKDIVGIIEIKANDHISLLFVDEKFQNKAIARSLIKQSIDLCLENKPDLTEISVNSSPNAIRIYEKLGFKQTGPEQLFEGIRFIPMVLKLSGFDNKNLTLIEITDEKERHSCLGTERKRNGRTGRY
jgi:GNAT superfamily N-acetyltransferase